MRVLNVECPPWLGERNLLRIACDYDPTVASLSNQPLLPDSLEVSPKQLAWAAMTSGRHLALEPDAYATRKRLFNQWRVISALGFVRYDEDDFLVKDDVLDEREPTCLLYTSLSGLARRTALPARSEMCIRDSFGPHRYHGSLSSWLDRISPWPDQAARLYRCCQGLLLFCSRGQGAFRTC